MSVIVRYDLPSPESAFIKNAFKAESVDSWMAPVKVSDIAICVGPVNDCPPAKKKVLFVMGQTKTHKNLDWDLVIVTSEKAKTLSLRKFGHGIKIKKIVPPVFGVNDACNRICEEFDGMIHASECSLGTIRARQFSLWGERKSYLPVMASEVMNYYMADRYVASSTPSAFSSFEYNSLIRGGAIGFYPEAMEDGYDIQVRRHLALGGGVICRQDEDVLGENFALAKYNEEMSEKEYLEAIREEIL